MSDKDINNVGLKLPQIQDIRVIWDDETAAGPRDEDEDIDMMDDMDNFIEYEDEEEPEAKEERQRKRRKLEKERRQAMGSRPELAGIDAG